MSGILYFGALSWMGSVAFLWIAIIWERQRRLLVAKKKRLQLSGNTAPGRIDEHRAVHIRQMNGLTPLYFLDYSYEVQGTRYKGSQRVTLQDFNSWREGTEVTVRYLPDEPQTASLEDISSGYFLKTLSLTGIVFFGFAGFLLVAPLACLLFWHFHGK